MKAQAWLNNGLAALVVGCSSFGATAAGDAIADAAAPIGDASPASDGSTALKPCRETFFDAFADDAFATRWDAVVPDRARLSVDPTDSLSPPGSLLVSRPEGGGAATLKKQAPRSKSVCCEFAFRGIAGANVFRLLGSGGNYTLHLSSDGNRLIPAEVLFVAARPDLGLSRVLTHVPVSNWTRIRLEATLPPVGKGTLAIYFQDAAGASGGGVVKDELGQTELDLGFDAVEIGILPSSEPAKADVHFDDVGCTFHG